MRCALPSSSSSLLLFGDHNVVSRDMFMVGVSDSEYKVCLMKSRVSQC